MFSDPRFLGAIAAAVAVLPVCGYFLFRRRVTPAEKERRRRLFVNMKSRTIEGVVTEFDSEFIHYVYELRCVQYSASQDVTALHDRLPEDPSRIIGVASIKYDPRNPANSIVLCEEWSGLSVMQGERIKR